MNKLKRIASFILVIAIIALYIAAFIMGITGNRYFIAILFLCIVIPIFLFAVSFVTRLLRQKGDEIKQNEEQ